MQTPPRYFVQAFYKTGTMMTANQKKKIIFTSFALLLLIHMVFVFAGFYNNDDIKYAKYAAKIASNGITFTPAASHYEVRWTVIVVTAFFYKLFGIGSFTSLLCSFLSLLFCGWLLHRMMRNDKLPVYFLSLLFFFFAHSIIFYMHRLLPDPAMCLIVLWMYLSYRTYRLRDERPLWYALQFALAILLAVITKETIIIVMPLFILFFLNDVFRKKQFAFWKYTVPLVAGFLFLYLFYFKLTTGSFFYRYQLLREGSYTTGCSYDVLPFTDTLKRIGYELWINLMLNGDMLILLPAIAGCINRNKLAEMTGLPRTDVVAFIVLLLSANFMTVSFTSYVPLCPDPRHFLFLFPFAALLAGPVLYAYFKRPQEFLILPLLIIPATVVMFATGAGNTKYIYLLFTILLTVVYLARQSSRNEYSVSVYIVLFTAVFSLNYLVDFIKPPYPYYRDHKKIIEEVFAGRKRDAKLFSADDFSGEMTKFFLSYHTGSLHILPMDSARTTTGSNLYYLLAGDLNPSLQPKVDSIINHSDSSHFSLVSREGNVSLYKTDIYILQELMQFYTKELNMND